jgi:hypothetical protein
MIPGERAQACIVDPRHQRRRQRRQAITHIVFGPKTLQPDGTLSSKMMFDYCHPRIGLEYEG